MQCSVSVGYQRFGGPCCLHLQGEVTTLKTDPTATLQGDIAQKNLTWTFTAVKTSNPFTI